MKPRACPTDGRGPRAPLCALLTRRLHAGPGRDAASSQRLIRAKRLLRPRHRPQCVAYASRCPPEIADVKSLPFVVL